MEALSLVDVIKSGTCIGCGACTAADPSLSLELDPVKQSFRPSHPGDQRAASVCPAIRVDFDMLHEERFPGQAVGSHGVVDSVWLAQSTDYDRNVGASSGGLIKEVLHALLRDEAVDGIISLVHRQGIDFGPELITDPEQIDSMPGSIYHAIDFSKALQLLKTNEGRFVLVAIPCQLEGIFSYIHKLEPSLKAKVHSTVGLLCGWQYTHHAIRAICEYTGVAFDELTDISWRGGGPVGKLRLTTASREKLVSRRLNFSYQVAFDRSFNIPRCHQCVNHSNFLADIVVGDAWLPSTVFTRTGISLIICRSPWTKALLDDLRELNRIVTVEVGEAEIVESQSRRVVFGDFAYAYQDFLSDRQLPFSTMQAPNRRESDLLSEAKVEEFHNELQRKLVLQSERRYRYLLWRKLVLELPALSKKYINWFTRRILRIQSLKGERVEVASSKLKVFR